MIRSFGGPEGFIQSWQGCLERDLARGGFAALRHLEAVLRLVQHCEAKRPDYSRLSDDELHALAERYAD